jgi:hypothetical protein
MKLKLIMLLIALVFTSNTLKKSSVRAGQTLAAPTLELPANGAVNQPTTTLWWTGLGQGARYGLQVSTDASFSAILVDRRDLVERAYALNQILSKNTTYYWRVNVTINGQTSAWSEGWKFTIAP